MDDRERTTMDPAVRGGKPCLRGMRLTVYDVLSYLAAGMTPAEVLEDFPYLEREDIAVALNFGGSKGSHAPIH